MKRFHACIAVSLSTVAMLAGCGDGTLPVQPSANVSAALFPAFALSGHVVDTAYRPIAGSRVEIVAGPRTGTVEFTDEDGDFSFEGMFTDVVTIRASKDGYQPETRIVPPPRVPVTSLVEGGMWEVQLYLAPLGPSADITGEYTLTMRADRACTELPAEMRTRTYTARIAPAGRAGFFTATLSDAAFFSEACPPGRPPESCVYNRFGIGLAGDYASTGVGIVEQLTATTYLAFEGGTEGSFGPAGIAGPFEGFFLYCPAEPAWNEGWVCPVEGGLQCDSHTHQLTLMRR